MLSVENIALREDPYQLFLDYFKNENTKRKYGNFLQNFLVLIPSKIYEDNGIIPPTSKNRDELARKFVELAQMNRKAAQNIIAAYIKEDKKLVNEKKLHPNTIPNHIKPIRTLFDSNDIVLNWKNLNRLLPRPQKTDDRAYTREELQRMLEASPTITDKLIIILFSACGFRVEAWDYFIWKDVEIFKNEDGRLLGGSILVYRCDPESYTSYFTPEAARYLEHYREVWKGDIGSYPKPDDPLIKTVRFQVVRRLNYKGIKNRVGKIVDKIGLRPSLESGRRRHEVALDHGFRKYFNTQLRRAKVDFLDKEDMMGHKVGLEVHYERYTSEKDRFSEYQKAIPFLTIFDTERVKFENQKLKEEISEAQLQRDEIERLKQAYHYVVKEINKIKNPT